MKATVVNSLSDAFQCGPGLVILDTGWPEFDPNDRAYFTPDSGKYIEAERLPPEWLALVGKTVCADEVTVGTIADLLEVLPPEVSEEWRKLYAVSDTDEGDDALRAFEEAHHIRWYGEGYYIDDGDDGEDEEDEEGDGDGEDDAQFTLEAATPSQLTAEAERERQHREIANRLAKPLKGSGEVNVQPQFDVGQTGQMDLFAPIVGA